MDGVRRPTLYDLYSGGGGCARGYRDAGFEVWGVDIAPQPHYCGSRFIQMDALAFIAAVMRGEYPMPDAWHASPPCQGYSRMLCVTGHTDKPKLIAETREALTATGLPYIIENVEMAKPDMRNWVLLCGTGFGLRVRRHRLFEMSPLLPILVPPCHCKNGVRDGALIGHRLSGPKPPGRKVPPVFTERELRTAIGVEWMPLAAMREAVPPAYTAFLGKHLMAALDDPSPSPTAAAGGVR